MQPNSPIADSSDQADILLDCDMAQLPIEAFPAWALLNNVDFANAEIRNIEGKGFGLVTKNDITNEGREASGAAPILRIPRDLVLSAEAVEEYAKVDQNFKQLLDVAGHQVGTAMFSCMPGNGVLMTTVANIWREHQGRHHAISVDSSCSIKSNIIRHEGVYLDAMDRVHQVPATTHPRSHHVDE